MGNILAEGLRMMQRRRQFKGFTAYKGTDKQICKAIINTCFDKETHYFTTSAGHFRQFYMRDFSYCTPALMRLGHRKEVHQTLQYALSIFSRHNMITTHITPDDRPVNAFGYPADSLPLLLFALHHAEAYDLIEVYKPFLNEQVLTYKERVLDSDGFVKRKTYFSSIKDGYKRNSSCYDNSCVALLQQEARILKLRNPFTKDHKQILLTFWNGHYFHDDLNKKDYVAGDANTFPFYFNIITDSDMRTKAIKAIQKEKLDLPLPLKYTNFRDKKKEIWQQRIFSPNYEGTTVWLHLGLAYLYVVAGHDKKLLKKYLCEMKNLIEKHKTFPEVLNPDGTPYHSAVYYCDEGMLWAAMYLDLCRT